MKWGIVASSGGSVFAESYPILRAADSTFEARVITDRECGFEDQCRKLDVECRRIKYSETFSKEAARILRGVDIVLLFFTRKVTRDLYGQIPTLNIHPSLLPKGKGLHAVERAYERKAKQLGCTLHLVHEIPDTGPILAQIKSPVSPGATLEIYQHVSFVQKTILTLLLFELIERRAISFSKDFSSVTLAEGLASNERCSPALTRPDFVKAVRRIEKREGVGAVL